MVVPWILCCMLLISNVIWALKILLLKKDLDGLSVELRDYMERETNSPLTIPPYDRHIRKVAAEINTGLSQLRHLRHKYRNGDRELKEAVTNISHDLRTPITAIYGYLDLLEYEEDTEAMRFYIKQIQNRTECMKQLTEELFRYSVVVTSWQGDYEDTVLNRALEESLDEMQVLVYKLYGEFVNVFQALIPALLLQYCKDGAFDFEIEGSTTSTFDTVKQFYLDVYESLGNLLVIPVALNDVKYRADVEKLASVEKNVVSLEDFIGLTKATRYHFCLKNEIYTDFLGVIVNPKLRNAIGHNDVEYDTASQVITYIPNPKDRTKKKTEYLLEFENEAIHMF